MNISFRIFAALLIGFCTGYTVPRWLQDDTLQVAALLIGFCTGYTVPWSWIGGRRKILLRMRGSHERKN